MMDDMNTDKNELDEKMHMKQILVAYSQKYDGNFRK